LYYRQTLSIENLKATALPGYTSMILLKATALPGYTSMILLKATALPGYTSMILLNDQQILFELTFQRRNVICFILGISPYRAVNTFYHGYKNQTVMIYKAKVAVCSEILTKHSTQIEHHAEFLNVRPGVR
jgi:hypothetical protein